MSQLSLINEAPVGSARTSPPRTWAGTLVNATERPTRYLHLMAFPCGKCKGPVVAGWIGTKQDDIAQETDITVMGAICLLCGSRPESLIDPLAAQHFRPVEWEWIAEKRAEAMEADADPLASEPSQDADTSHNSPGFSDIRGRP